MFNNKKMKKTLQKMNNTNKSLTSRSSKPIKYREKHKARYKVKCRIENQNHSTWTMSRERSQPQYSSRYLTSHKT